MGQESKLLLELERPGVLALPRDDLLDLRVRLAGGGVDACGRGGHSEGAGRQRQGGPRGRSNVLLEALPRNPELLGQPEGAVVGEEVLETVGLAGVEGTGAEDRGEDAVEEARETSRALSDLAIQHLRQNGACGAHERSVAKVGPGPKPHALLLDRKTQPGHRESVAGHDVTAWAEARFRAIEEGDVKTFEGESRIVRVGVLAF